VEGGREGVREGCFLMSTKLVMRICPPTPLFAKEVGGGTNKVCNKERVNFLST